MIRFTAARATTIFLAAKAMTCLMAVQAMISYKAEKGMIPMSSIAPISTPTPLTKLARRMAQARILY
jgi:hypothetical protein